MKVDPKTEAERESRFEGLAVSPGIAIGPVHVHRAGAVTVVQRALAAEELDAENQRFLEALERARLQLEKIRTKAARLHGAAGEELSFLLEAHCQMLSSRRLIDGVQQRISGARINAEAAVESEVAAISASFAEMDDPYLKARGRDIEDVGQRILRALSRVALRGFEGLAPGSIVAAEEITPADAALMNPRQIAGFACTLGGVEGHTAIMARSLGLPAVLGVSGFLEACRAGATIVVDGSSGCVVVNPSEETLGSYQDIQAALAEETAVLARLRDLPAVTRDGQRILLQANLDLPRDAGEAVLAGAEGSGLLRTEFMFMNREDLPSEDEQAEVLCEVVRAMAGRPITMRTLDVGGEKLVSGLDVDQAAGANPALGLRAIRLSLKQPELLETQFAAMLRASALGPVRILLPMICSIAEVRAARACLEQVAERLGREDVAIADPLPPLGIMIEVPGAALAADSLARESDFFAIGTNDLIMYTLAIDRGEERVAHLYDPLHAAVLRLIHFAVDAALRHGKPVSVCGEMAGDPRYTALFVGLGVRELSMHAKALPRVKDQIRRMNSGAAANLVMESVIRSDSRDVARLLDVFNAMAGNS